jgi:hypothetical protein
MLLRLVLACGLITHKDIAGYYARRGASTGVRSLQQFLLSHGVDLSSIDAVRRAYAETIDFGSLIINHLRNVRHLDETRLRAARRALNACETAQLMAIKKGRPAKPIGEMVVDLGHITAAELDQLVVDQGMLQRVRRYAEEARRQPSLAERLGLDGLRRKLTPRRLALAGLVAVLAVVAYCNLCGEGPRGAMTREMEVFGREFEPHDTEQHIKMTVRHYGNMMTELRLGRVDNAEHYRRLLATYFAAMELAGVPVEDQQMLRIRNTYKKLVFEKVREIPAAELSGLSDLEVEARLR